MRGITRSQGGAWLSEHTRMPLVDLPYTVGGTPEAKDLFGLFDDIIARLKKEKITCNLEFGILLPALLAGLLVTATHVPLGIQVLSRGIVFIDIAIAQIAGVGVIAADFFGLEDRRLRGAGLGANGRAWARFS